MMPRKVSENFLSASDWYWVNVLCPVLPHKFYYEVLSSDENSHNNSDLIAQLRENEYNFSQQVY